MDVSPVSGGAVSSALESGSSVHTAVALAAFKSSLQSQAAILQLFDPATAVPAPETGRGQNLNVSA